MKKMIAVLLFAAFFIPRAFGQLNFNGSAWMDADLASSKFVNGDAEDILTSGNLGFEFFASIQTRDGTAGAKGRLYPFDANDPVWAYAWWRPIKELYFKLGRIREDGIWTGMDLVGWAFDANSFDGVTRKVPGYGHIPGFWDSYFGPMGIQLSVMPVRGFTFNMGFPLNDIAKAEETYFDNMVLQAAYNMPGLGDGALTFENGTGVDGAANSRNLYLQWRMRFQYSLRLETSISYKFHETLDLPFGFGLGFAYDGNPLLAKMRTGVEIPTASDGSTHFFFDLLFVYDLGILKVHVPGGIALEIPSGGDTAFGWHFRPYISKDLGGPSFYAGVSIWSALLENGRAAPKMSLGKEDLTLNWVVPVGIRWDF